MHALTLWMCLTLGQVPPPPSVPADGVATAAGDCTACTAAHNHRARHGRPLLRRGLRVALAPLRLLRHR